MMKNKINKFLFAFLMLLNGVSYANESNDNTVRIDNISDATKYIGYKDEISLSVPKIIENQNEGTIPSIKDGHSNNVIPLTYSGDIIVKDIKDDNENYDLTLKTTNTCSMYSYNRKDYLKTVRIDFCNGYVGSIRLSYNSADKYRLSSEEINYNLKEIIKKVELMGFKKLNKTNLNFLDLGVYDDEVTKLQKDNILISIVKDKRSDSIFIGITEKDLEVKWAKAKKELDDKSKIKNDENIESFFK